MFNISTFFESPIQDGYGFYFSEDPFSTWMFGHIIFILYIPPHQSFPVCCWCPAPDLARVALSASDGFIDRYVESLDFILRSYNQITFPDGTIRAEAISVRPSPTPLEFYRHVPADLNGDFFHKGFISTYVGWFFQIQRIYSIFENESISDEEPLSDHVVLNLIMLEFDSSCNASLVALTAALINRDYFVNLVFFTQNVSNATIAWLPILKVPSSLLSFGVFLKFLRSSWPQVTLKMMTSTRFPGMTSPPYTRPSSSAIESVVGTPLRKTFCWVGGCL